MQQQEKTAPTRAQLIREADRLSKRGDLEHARGVYQYLLDRDGDDAEVFYLASLVNEREGRADPAFRLMLRAVEAAPGNGEYFRELARLWSTRNDDAGTVACYVQALKKGVGKHKREVIQALEALLGFPAQERPVTLVAQRSLAQPIRLHAKSKRLVVAGVSTVERYCREHGERYEERIPAGRTVVHSCQPEGEGGATEVACMMVPPAYVAELSGAMVTNGKHLLLGADFTVLSDLFSGGYWNGKPIARSSWDEPFGRTVALFTGRTMRKAMIDKGLEVDGPVPEAISLLTRTDVIWTNWLVEVLPKLMLVEQDERYARLPLLVNRNVPPTALEALELLNVSKRRVVLLDSHWVEPQRHWSPRTYRFKRLVIPSGLACFAPGTEVGDHLINPAGLHWLRERLLPLVARDRPRRIYLSRAQQPRRRVVNEEEVTRLLERYGFETVVPEGLSFIEQLRLWANAEIAVGPAGSAMMGSVFSPRGTCMIGLARVLEEVNFTEGMQLSAELEQRTIILSQQVVGEGGHDADLNSDFTVDVERLEEALRSLGFTAPY